MALIGLCIAFVALLLVGVPVAFAIGLSSVVAVVIEGLPLEIVFQRMSSGMNIFSFLAIPFFVFAGELMLHGGIADRIVRFANAMAGHVRGGLGMSNVVACTLFGGISGSAVADVSAMGSVLIPMMKKKGYGADYAVNVTTHASLVGVLMPTSHNIIIYSLATGGAVSIGAMMFAGLLPALVLFVCMLAAAYGVAVRRGYAAEPFAGYNLILRTLIAALPGLFVGVIILAGILSGIFTLTESAAVAVLYALAVTALVYRSLDWNGFVMAAARAVKTTATVLLLIGVASCFDYLMAFYQVPGLVSGFIKSVSDEPWLVFLLINVFLLVVGTFMDMAGTILICTPILLPVVKEMGMDPVQFGMVMLLNCAIGLNTPPVGTVQFVGCAIGKISVGEVMKTIWPFYGALVAALMAVTYVPAFSLWLPGFLGLMS